MKVIWTEPIAESAVSAWVEALVKSPVCLGVRASSFAGQPTNVLFRPEASFPASMHFMYFPPGFTQPLHTHEGGRHLIILGGCDMTIATSVRDYRIPRFCLGMVRFPSGFVHAFSADTNGGLGCAAFSFHENDGDDKELAERDDLMEILTTFVGGERAWKP